MEHSTDRAVGTGGRAVVNAGVSVRELRVSYGTVRVLDGLSLDFEPGTFTCILGPSGCGKSTLLQAIGGFCALQGGEVKVADRPAVVFQRHNLFPWKTARENVALGLRVAGHTAEVARLEAEASLSRVGLGDRADAYPFELSLGQQQRVGIARAFSLRSPVLLMDEPFGALDAQTRIRMQQLLLGIWADARTTVIFVTHDLDEAILLGDRVVTLSGIPAQIVGDFRVEAARPRRFSDLATPALADLRQRVFDLL